MLRLILQVARKEGVFCAAIPFPSIPFLGEVEIHPMTWEQVQAGLATAHQAGGAGHLLANVENRTLNAWTVWITAEVFAEDALPRSSW